MHCRGGSALENVITRAINVLHMPLGFSEIVCCMSAALYRHLLLIMSASSVPQSHLVSGGQTQPAAQLHECNVDPNSIWNKGNLFPRMCLVRHGGLSSGEAPPCQMLLKPPVQSINFIYCQSPIIPGIHVFVLIMNHQPAKLCSSVFLVNLSGIHWESFKALHS